MSGRGISLDDFLGRVREYLPEGYLTRRPQNGGKVAPPPLRPNCFFQLDAEVMLAFSRAVEDVAMDDAQGRLLSSFQDFGKFQTHRERYTHISTTLDEVLVLGSGRNPAPCGQTQFISSRGTALEHFWISMYQGPRVHVLAISRQVNAAKEIPDKIFRGFFTFDARLISRLRREVFDALDGCQPAMPQFSQLLAIDEAQRQIRGGFQTELAALEAELEAMRLHPRINARNFASQLNGALDRLEALRHTVPALFHLDALTVNGSVVTPKKKKAL